VIDEPPAIGNRQKLFGIDPSTLELVYHDEGPDASDLGVTRSSIDHLVALPHRESLEWVWPKFRPQAESNA
jgi:hypothetical protein